jgi:ATP-dependent protease ClpP protease subunit
MAEQKPFLNVIRNKATREATIYIYGAIGGFDMETFQEKNTAEKFNAEFNAIEADADTIHVRINSPGGYVFEGLAIYNALFASEKRIITYNDGVCASMAADILMTGDEIHAFPNALLMIHNSSSSYYGNKKEVEEQLKASEKIDKARGTAIELRLGISAEEVAEKYLNYKDNWYTAKEAEEIGFYDHIIEKGKAVLPDAAASLSTSELFKQYAAMSFSIPNQESNPNKPMKKPNSYPNLEATLGLSEPLASTENGSFLNEEQKANIETKLTAAAKDVQTANEAKTTAEAALATEKETAKTALDAATATGTAATTQLRAAATLAGVEDLPEAATAEEINTALTAQIEVLNTKPGAVHTAGASNGEVPAGTFAIDKNNSIYSQLK